MAPDRITFGFVEASAFGERLRISAAPGTEPRQADALRSLAASGGAVPAAALKAGGASC